MSETCRGVIIDLTTGRELEQAEGFRRQEEGRKLLHAAQKSFALPTLETQKREIIHLKASLEEFQTQFNGAPGLFRCSDEQDIKHAKYIAFQGFLQDAMRVFPNRDYHQEELDIIVSSVALYEACERLSSDPAEYTDVTRRFYDLLAQRQDGQDIQLKTESVIQQVGAGTLASPDLSR